MIETNNLVVYSISFILCIQSFSTLNTVVYIFFVPELKLPIIKLTKHILIASFKLLLVFYVINNWIVK